MRDDPRWGPVACVCLFVLAVLSVPVHSLGEEYFLFTSFRGNGEDGLHLAVSTDGYHWQALNHDRSFLKPEVGGYKLMRDPCLAEGPDGTFRLVWTCGWTADKGRTVGYAHSKDLIHWSEQKGIAVMQNEPNTRNIWAPEVFYEKARRCWMIFWSSTIPGRYAGTDGTGDDAYNHRFYFTTTADFQSFEPSQLLYDPGFNAIDATLLQAGAKFYLFFKDERKTPLKKNLRYATAAQPEGPFGKPSEPFTRNWVEGPSAIRIKGEYLVYFDHYVQPAYYGAVRSKDLEHWEDCAKEMSFPKGHRHGTVLRIPQSLARRLMAVQ
ncbi:MAG TPA: glycoside hydrolase family 43 protein [Candidatus Acidoferrum sp.]|nr:glycoside hydrolase family 43 protein [Candidatus Acidoferrum sp.]